MGARGREIREPHGGWPSQDPNGNKVSAGDMCVKSVPNRGARRPKGVGTGTALTCFGEGDKADGGWSIMCSGLSSG